MVLVRRNRAACNLLYMLPVKSKYKIAKRLGANVFEKTQSQKFALSEARSAMKKRKGGRGGSDYNRQLLEKQRVRYTYGLAERQLANYAKRAYELENPSQTLHAMLEMRVDSIAYRSGLAATRRAARQMASHGHLLVNGKRVTTPSHALAIGDVVTVREGSRTSPLFAHMTGEGAENRNIPSWLIVDRTLMKVEVKGEPLYGSAETTLDYPTVFEFYSR